MLAVVASVLLEDNDDGNGGKGGEAEMADVFSARRLEQEVDTLISRALRVGRGGAVPAALNGRPCTFSVDHIVSDEAGLPCEVWLSAASPDGLWQRLLNAFRGVERRDLVRVTREAGDVRRSVTTVEISVRGVVHVDYREEIGAPRVSRSVARFNYPRGDAASWIHAYRKAS
jgi:hypothetical protein